MAQQPKINITEFDPIKHPWPKEIIKWPYNGYQPRDCSWGFVLDKEENQIHIHSGNLIISAFGEKYLCRKDKLKMVEKVSGKIQSFSLKGIIIK